MYYRSANVRIALLLTIDVKKHCESTVQLIEQAYQLYESALWVATESKNPALPATLRNTC
jgi:hypothetical protein